MSDNMISERYLQLRENALNYTNEDMNLALDDDSQIYLAVFDIPSTSITLPGNGKSLVLIFGLNTHMYFVNGEAMVDLEKNPAVMKAMQSLFISAPQVLNQMELTTDYSYKSSSSVRAFLKTRKGVYYKELLNETKAEKFLTMLMNNVLSSIGESL